MNETKLNLKHHDKNQTCIDKRYCKLFLGVAIERCINLSGDKNKRGNKWFVYSLTISWLNLF